ncbi:MAG: transposase [Bryobacterales bacterium]|nr:transposase [Bryobacterales bacterium]
MQKISLPKSALGQAVNCTLSLWKKLAEFLEHPVAELSNNLAENPMRGVAPGMADGKHHDAKTPPPSAGNSVTPDHVRQE